MPSATQQPPRATFYRHDKATEGKTLAIEHDWISQDPPNCRVLVIRLANGRGTVEVLVPNEGVLAKTPRAAKSAKDKH